MFGGENGQEIQKKFETAWISGFFSIEMSVVKKIIKYLV